MASADREPITAVRGRSSRWGPWALGRTPGQRVRGRSRPKAESFEAFVRLKVAVFWTVACRRNDSRTKPASLPIQGDKCLAPLAITVGAHGSSIIRLQYRERKCADTFGTVLVPWAGHFQC